ncbi:hypothetical protein BDV95DRAFT_631142 [Massariosphaeria phaeospora]|uniref:Translation initiation factor 5A-like N-terminal domain-containing protein n=1 Tax=Massariosphaeria phaeospora TaxID=100035 RepID=A0A7C8I0G4_9PLEO|nr:hypothetical protein BDV95DRAFT_631142 [Massariosphaeria phaeospora]
MTVFPSSYRSDAVTKESTQVQAEGEAKLPSQTSHVGREGHEEHHLSATTVKSATVKPVDHHDTRYKEEVRVYEQGRVRRPQQPQQQQHLQVQQHSQHPQPQHHEQVHIHEETRYRQPEQRRPEQPQQLRSEQHHKQHVEFEVARDTRDRYQKPLPSQHTVGSHTEVQARTYDRDFNTVHGPATDYAPTQIDITERQFRERTRPIAGAYAAEQGYTSLNTKPNHEHASGYAKETYSSTHETYPQQRREVDTVDRRYPARGEVRVEHSTRSTVDQPKQYKRDMGYYDEDGHYHSFRHGLHKAASKVSDRIAHPIHGARHHHSSSHSHTGSKFDDRREEVVVKEKYTTTAAAPSAAPVRAISSGRPVEQVRVASASTRTMAPHPPNTITIPCHHIRIGDLLILQGRPCQVIRITTSSQTGQHRYLGVDLFTKQLHEESSFISNPSPSVIVQNMLGPVFKQYRVLDIREDGRVVAMTETGDVKQGLPVLDQSGLLNRLTESFDNGRGSVRILVINDDGLEMAVDYKVVHGSRL